MNPKWRNVIVIALVVVVVLSGIGVYLQVRSSASKGCSLSSTNPIQVDQAEVTDTADPQWASSTPDWGLVQQIYQTLVMYNQTSLTNFTGVLAQNWTSSPSRLNWNFTLRSGVYFSNGDPFNAYVMWFSLYREIAMFGINQYLLAENFWLPDAIYPDNSTEASLLTDLNTFNFFDPTAPEIQVMEAGNQSFQVINPSTIEVNLGAGYNDYDGAIPYTYLLAELSTPGAAAVDPAVIDANGGVVYGATNSWMSTHALGTGPYNLTYYNDEEGYTLTPNGHYWATAVAAEEPWNNNLQPAKATIEVTFQENLGVTVTDLKSGSAATASFAYFGPSAALSELKGAACVVVEPLSPVFSGAGGSWWVFMNQSVYPFNNLSVRAAIAHAINYTQVIDDAFGGYAFPWVGPVPPGSPYYNPDNLTPYPYNLSLAMEEIAHSPCANGACSHLSFAFEYIETGTSTVWEDTATLIADDLSAIGITVDPVGVTLSQFYDEQGWGTVVSGVCTSDLSGSQNQGLPQFFIGEDFYSSDYISPDDWTQQDFLSYGSANICNSGYNAADTNDSLNDLVFTAAGETNPAQLNAAYAEMSQLMYTNYTNIWFAVPDLFAVYNPALHGWEADQTPMGSTEVETMSWNTVYAT